MSRRGRCRRALLGHDLAVPVEVASIRSGVNGPRESSWRPRILLFRCVVRGGGVQGIVIRPREWRRYSRGHPRRRAWERRRMESARAQVAVSRGCIETGSSLRRPRRNWLVPWAAGVAGLARDHTATAALRCSSGIISRPPPPHQPSIRLGFFRPIDASGAGPAQSRPCLGLAVVSARSPSP